MPTAVSIIIKFVSNSSACINQRLCSGFIFFSVQHYNTFTLPKTVTGN